MRFIGNKENLIHAIYDVLKERHISGNSFCDFFSGTTNVARFFKKLNYKIISSDLLYFSYCLQKAYIVNNEEPKFKNLLSKININSDRLFEEPLDIVIGYLNNLPLIDGFIYKNYSPLGSKSLEIPRMYFSDKNAQKIDSIRTKIEEWYKEKDINENEYFILLACLIESVPFYANISGVYAAFRKKWDPRALKDFRLRTIQIISNNKNNLSFNVNSINLIDNIDVDILYLDPPYNERQYAPNYHLLETIAKYDNPDIKGITGMRDYKTQKSNFCNKELAIKELEKVIKQVKYKYLVLSYNNEGIMEQDKILNLFNKYGNVELVEFDYTRFKSNSNGLSKTKKQIKEQLYIFKKTGYKI